MTTTKLDAEHYNDNSLRQKSLANGILPLHSFKSDESILDIGCGDGVITAQLATFAPEGKVLGIDLSSEMIDFAKQTFPQDKFTNLSFENLSAEGFCFDSQYSLITAFNSLYWVRDLPKAFGNIYQALTIKGKLLALLYPRESPYWDLFIQTFKNTKFSEWYNLSICPTMLTTEEYINLATKLGFKVLSADTFIEAPRSYANKEEFKDYVNGWLPCLLPASKDVLADYLDSVANLAWDRYKNSDGSANLPYKKLHLYLEK